MSATLAAAAPLAPATDWRRHLSALALAAAAILLLFWRDAAHLVSIWWNSSTFNHCLLIPPILYWLVVQRAPELKQLAPRAWLPGLALVGLGAVAWLLGEAGSLALARHAGLVMMLQGAVVTLLGKAVARGLLFPLAFALFLIPVGEQLVPPLQTITAHMATWLLGLVGIPAHLEGVFITTSFGYFEVAEACAGAKFLIAMLAFGALVANVCFRSWRRRILFLLAAAIVPVLANGIRAWGIIVVAHWAGIETATGFDHVVYGGVFFALVIALLLGLAWRHFDRAPDDSWLDSLPTGSTSNPSLAAAAALLLALAALPLAWTRVAAAAPSPAVAADFALPDVPGWTRVPAHPDWQPRFAGADLVRAARYRDARGRVVDLHVVAFAQQAEGRELVGSGQGQAPGWAWIDNAVLSPVGGRGERIASHGRVREVLTFYRVGERLTGSETQVKLESVRIRLLGGPRRAVAVLVSAPAPAQGTSAQPGLSDFLAALGPIERHADRAAAPR